MIRCWIDNDGEGHIYCGETCKASSRGIPCFLDWGDHEPGIDVAHDEFLKRFHGHWIADKLRDLLAAEREESMCVEAQKPIVSVNNVVSHEGCKTSRQFERNESLPAKRARLESARAAIDAELAALPDDRLASIGRFKNDVLIILGGELSRGDQQRLVNWLAQHGIVAGGE